MSISRKLILAVLAMGLVAGTATTASAGWRANHPRRVEVNGRLGNQNARIRHNVADGNLTTQQAQQLHSEDHTIRQEERFDASLDHGHITKADQRSLNQQENAVSGQIYNESH